MIRSFGNIAVVSAGLLGAACAPVGESWIVNGMAAAAANDQIMLVRSDPPSFGFQRMRAQARAFPDIGVFVAQRGVPDFLAETGDRRRHYLIFYYLRDREAYACRTRSGRGGGVEFAGPYPVTDREFKLLDDFRKDSNAGPAKVE
jgi:hypothetical protein